MAHATNADGSPIDPSYGYTQASLLDVKSPSPAKGFEDFWRKRYAQTRPLHPQASLHHTGRKKGNFELYDLCFHSSSQTRIHGWVLIPSKTPISKAIVVGHGYGGCNEPDGHVPCIDAVYIYLCYRGLSRSRMQGVPENPNYHVLYDIQDPERYILGGCVDDTWMAVNVIEQLFPDIRDHIGFMGISFSGGIGIMALPWDARIRRAHVQVPSFGHQPLRLQLPTIGSANAVSRFAKKHPHIINTLNYYDAAIAAQFVNVPVHVAPALSDPVVAPPGQFAIYNALPKEKSLFILSKGHQEYSKGKSEHARLMTDLTHFFKGL